MKIILGNCEDDYVAYFDKKFVVSYAASLFAFIFGWFLISYILILALFTQTFYMDS